MLESFGGLLVGLPVHVADACRALQLHVAVQGEVVLGRHEPQPLKERSILRDLDS